MNTIVRNSGPNMGSLTYISKSFSGVDPVSQVLGEPGIDLLIRSRRKNRSILQQEWGQTYHTTSPTVRAVELQREVGPSSETSILQRNQTGVHINPMYGGVTPAAYSSVEVELMVLQNHITVQMDEIHGRRSTFGPSGIFQNPKFNEYHRAGDLIAEKLAMIADQMTDEINYQSAVCITRGYVPSIMSKDEIVVDFRSMFNAQVGAYEIPKANKRDVGTIPIILSMRDFLSREASRYSEQTKFILLCNQEFLTELLRDERLMNSWINQPLELKTNPLYSGRFLSQFARVDNVDIVRDDTSFTYPAKKAANAIEMREGKALTRMASSGNTVETNRFKDAKPSARLIAVMPNQFVMVKGVLHGNEGPNSEQRIKAQASDFDTGIVIVNEQIYMPFYSCAHLALDVTIASGDDVTGVGKLKTAPTRYQAKS